MRNPIFRSKMSNSGTQGAKFEKIKFLKILIWSKFGFLIFALWTLDFLIFDLKIGFLIKNCIYRQLDMSRIPYGDKKNNKILWGTFFLTN